MKKIKFLFAKAVIALVIILSSCTKENSFYIESGKDGSNGNDGKNGYSLSIRYNSLGNTEDYYWERDNVPGFTAGDTVVYQKNSEGLLIVKDKTGCTVISKIVGLDTIPKSTICNGKDAFNTVYGSRPMLDKNNKVIGSYLDLYWDKDAFGTSGYGVLGENDEWKFTVPISNGTTVIPEMKVISEKISVGTIYSFYVNGVLNSKDTTYHGQTGGQGPKGDHPILNQIHCSNGIVFQWFVGGEKVSDDFFPYAINGVDGNDGKDGVDGIDGTNGENGTDGKDGADAPVGTSIACLTQHFNFQGVNDNYFTNTGIVLSGFVFSATDGALYCGSKGSIILPPTTMNNKLLYSSFKYGAKKAFSVTVKVIYYNGLEEVISTFIYNGNPNFNRKTFSTYGKFEYKADLSNIRFANVKNIKIEAVKIAEVGKTSTNKCSEEVDFFVDDDINVFSIEK